MESLDGSIEDRIFLRGRRDRVPEENAPRSDNHDREINAIERYK